MSGLEWSIEVDKKQRFRFGRNWTSYVEECLSEDRIKEAQSSLISLLSCESLKGKTFLDIGCGSGIFSLAAHRLGAQVVSLDYDYDAVECTRYVIKQYAHKNLQWDVYHGSVLDTEFIRGLGEFDIIYSWGVLHHTGDMFKALQNSLIPSSRQGSIVAISIYNDQGFKSRVWKRLKSAYISSKLKRAIISMIYFPYAYSVAILLGIYKHGTPWGHIQGYKSSRGMSFYHDLVDWLGGYPFEVAKPEVVFRFYRDNGYALREFTTTNSLGCNQFCFTKL